MCISELNVCYTAKISIILMVIMVQMDAAGNYLDEIELPFRTTSFLGMLGNNVTMDVRNAFLDLHRRVDEFVQNGSNWIFEGVASTIVEFAK